MSQAATSRAAAACHGSSARAPLVLFALALVALPFLLPNAYYFDVAIRIAINATLAIALNLLIGYTGQISLGHAAFFGLGAYGSAILTGRVSTGRRRPRWSSAPPRSALVAYVVARVILRLEGHYLAMATLGLGVIATIALTNEVALTGGPDGMPVADFSVLGLRIVGRAAVVLAVRRAAGRRDRCWRRTSIDSPAGRALRALHGSEIAARARRRRLRRVQDARLRALGDRRLADGLALRPLRRLHHAGPRRVPANRSSW